MAGGRHDSNQQQDVVDLLRDRIRCNALELLSRADAATTARRSPRGGEDEGIGGTPKMSSSPYDLLSVQTATAASTPLEVEEEEKKDGDSTIVAARSPRYDAAGRSKASSTSLATPTELTKRLQQLALQRQEESAASAAASLRVIQSGDTHLSSAATFEQLLPPHLLQSVYEMGFNRPSEIQSATLPLIFGGRNVIAQAQSGSGKTVAFSLGVLFHVQTTTNHGGGLQQHMCQPSQTQAVILTPTRELAIQAYEQAIKPLSSHVPHGTLTVQLAISGTHVEVGAKVQSHVVIGTPGKITDWLKRRTLDVRHVRVFVLDEADSMVDGFRAKTLQIYKHMPPTVQCLFFSATFPPLVVDFAAKLVRNPDLVLIEHDEELVLEVIKQLWVDTRQYPGGKIMFLADIYALMTIGQSIVFVETRNEADDVHATLSGAGYSVSLLHSNLEADERDSTMQDFRNGASSVLITTNVLARGANVDNVCLVINYNLPTDRHGHGDYETYLHRIGRTGRFGRKGTAINLVDTEHSHRVLEEIQQHFNAKMTHVEADPEALANEIQI
jgi:ATP-dependent RNA helicase DDX19/DBP5